MSPAAAAEPDGVQRDRHISKLIFFLSVLGAILLCVGVLLSIFGFQACQHNTLRDCSVVLKVAGPACAAVGLGAVILARSRAQLQLREGRWRGDRADPNRAFLCGQSRQFAQYLIFGFLFLTSGMLVSILGIWVPGCGSDWAPEPLNKTDTTDMETPMCGFLSLQIMGPLIVLVGLCFFVIAHVKKRNNLNAGQDASECEERQTPNTEPVQVTVVYSGIKYIHDVVQPSPLSISRSFPSSQTELCPHETLAPARFSASACKPLLSGSVSLIGPLFNSGVSAGDAVIIFPAPPPPYFSESSASAVTRSPGPNGLLPSENPPSYDSMFNYGTPAPEGQGAASEGDCAPVYTISGTTSSSEIPHAPCLSSELPPRYEEKETAAAASLSPSSEPSPP